VCRTLAIGMVLLILGGIAGAAEAEPETIKILKDSGFANDIRVANSQQSCNQSSEKIRVRIFDVKLFNGRFIVRNVRQTYYPARKKVRLEIKATEEIKKLVHLIEKRFPDFKDVIGFDGEVYSLTFQVNSPKPFVENILKFSNKDGEWTALIKKAGS